MNFKIKPADLILTGVLILASFGVFLFPKAPEGRTVQVFLNGKSVADLPLAQSQTLVLDNVGTIVVEDGTVLVRDMSCPDRICEQTGAISRQGQVILCLPNRLCIRILSEEVDGVAY